MKISSKGEYGLLAIVDLALHLGQSAVQSLQIAERQGIPKQYLDQLMLNLKKAGLVSSSRGRQGGYVLARPAGHITLLDVVTALEGPLDNSNFLSKGSQSKSAGRAVLNAFWSELTEDIKARLRSKTLEEISDEYKRTENQIMYHI